jgi:DNA-binding CsgD family transcriptional regulator
LDAYDLTEREIEVLTLARDGLTSSEIGVRLSIKRGTVDAHLMKIYRKLMAGGRIQAIRVAVAKGYLKPMED